MTEKAEVLHQLADEAHASCVSIDGSFPPRPVAIKFVGLVEALEAYGRPWVSAFNDALKIDGAMKFLADWRRRQQISARTKRGTRVSLPAFAGRRNAEGRHEQARLFDMDLASLRAHADKVSRQRDTLSRELQVLRDAIKGMEADGSLTTAGAAFTKLGLVA